MIKLRLSTVAILITAAHSMAAFAEDSTILIERRHNKYPYQCHAHECFSPDSEKKNRLKNAKDLVDQYCSPSMRRDIGNEQCEREQENHAVMEQCLRIECIKSACKKTDLMTGRCVGGAYFR
jgi:hypothetical protein